MKATDLRIGNWFRYQTKIGYDYDIFDTKYIQDLVNDPQDDFFEPIPLTEDILLKCGFSVITENEDETHNYWNKEKDCSVDVETFLLTNKIEKGFKYRVHERKRTKSIIYLHQLQNLYFALTGEELTIKL